MTNKENFTPIESSLGSPVAPAAVIREPEIQPEMSPHQESVEIDRALSLLESLDAVCRTAQTPGTPPTEKFPAEQPGGTVDSGLEPRPRAELDRCPLSIIVPVFNERRTLPRILQRIEEVAPEGTQTIVVDDASTDGTAEWLGGLAPRRRRTVLLRKRNHGKGSAVRLGIRHSRGSIVAIQDADDEYDPIDLMDAIRLIQRGQAEVVYGSRYLSGSDDPSTLHRLGNWALTAMSNCMTGQRLTDMETCHKAFRGDLARSMNIRECRFGFEPEVTSKIAARGITIAEVPTGYQYRSYEEGKKITWKDGVAALACMWRYRNPGWIARGFAGFGRILLRLPKLLRRR